MKEFDILPAGIPLFAGLSGDELRSVLTCLSARTQTYAKDQPILSEDDTPTEVGIVLSGSVIIHKEDFWGNRDIIAKLGPAALFAESFSCAGSARLPVSVTAAESSSVLFVNCRKILTVCSNTCVFHTALIQNLLQIIATKNIGLTQKMEHLSKRSTREKLMSYLSQEARSQRRNPFVIPYNRQELADFLSVDRSAMSTELGKLRDAGLLKYHKNEFTLLQAKPYS
jgi:CRP-like cAMP-binding protein